MFGAFFKNKGNIIAEDFRNKPVDGAKVYDTTIRPFTFLRRTKELIIVVKKL